MELEGKSGREESSGASVFDQHGPFDALSAVRVSLLRLACPSVAPLTCIGAVLLCQEHVGLCLDSWDPWAQAPSQSRGVDDQGCASST